MAAIITAACFIFTSVIAQPALAIVEKTKESRRLDKVFLTDIVPAAVGRVTSARDCGSRRVAVVIQDLHCHEEVQRNIARVFELIDRRWGLNKIYVEGAVGELDTSWASRVRDSGVRQILVEGLMKRGKLTGAEYYSMRAGKPDILYGLENDDVYRENLLRFEKLTASQEKIEGVLSDMRGELNIMKSRHFTRETRRFDHLRGRYRQGELSPEKYHRILEKYENRIGMSPAGNSGGTSGYQEFPSLAGYRALLEDGRDLRWDKITRELHSFMSMAKGRLPYSVYQRIMKETESFNRANELYGYLNGVVKEYSIPTEAFPELKKFLRYMENSRSVNPLGVVKEERRLAYSIGYSLAQDEAERRILFLSNYFDIAEDYLKGKLSGDDYAYFRGQYEEFRLRWKQYADSDRFDQLNDEWKLCADYYRVNEERNNYFVNAIMPLSPSPCQGAGRVRVNSHPSDDSRRIEDILADAEEVIGVVTGGFHTEKLTKLLEAQGITCITITPNVTKDAGEAEKIYHSLIYAQSRVFGQALAPMLQEMVRQVFENKLAGGKMEEALTAAGALAEPIAEVIVNDIPSADKEEAVRDVLKDLLGEAFVRASLAKDNSSKETTLKIVLKLSKENIETAIVFDADGHLLVRDKTPLRSLSILFPERQRLINVGKRSFFELDNMRDRFFWIAGDPFVGAPILETLYLAGLRFAAFTAVSCTGFNPVTVTFLSIVLTSLIFTFSHFDQWEKGISKRERAIRFANRFVGGVVLSFTLGISTGLPGIAISGVVHSLWNMLVALKFSGNGMLRMLAMVAPPTMPEVLILNPRNVSEIQRMTDATRFIMGIKSASIDLKNAKRKVEEKEREFKAADPEQRKEWTLARNGLREARKIHFAIMEKAEKDIETAFSIILDAANTKQFEFAKMYLRMITDAIASERIDPDIVSELVSHLTRLVPLDTSHDNESMTRLRALTAEYIYRQIMPRDSLLHGINDIRKVLSGNSAGTDILQALSECSQNGSHAATRTGLLIILRHSNNPQILRNILGYRSVDMRLKLYAFSHIVRSSRITVDECSDMIAQMTGNKTDMSPLREFLKEYSGDRAWLDDLLRDPWLQDEEAKPFVIAVHLLLSQTVRDVDAFGQSSTAMKIHDTIVRPYAAYSNSDLVFGGWFISHSPQVFFQIIAHEIGHGILKDNNVSATGQETAALMAEEFTCDAFAALVAYLLGQDMSDYTRLLKFDEDYERVERLRFSATDIHDGAHALFRILEKAYEKQRQENPALPENMPVPVIVKAALYALEDIRGKEDVSFAIFGKGVVSRFVELLEGKETEDNYSKDDEDFLREPMDVTVPDVVDEMMSSIPRTKKTKKNINLAIGKIIDKDRNDIISCPVIVNPAVNDSVRRLFAYAQKHWNSLDPVERELLSKAAYRGMTGIQALIDLLLATKDDNLTLAILKAIPDKYTLLFAQDLQRMLLNRSDIPSGSHNSGFGQSEVTAQIASQLRKVNEGALSEIDPLTAWSVIIDDNGSMAALNEKGNIVQYLPFNVTWYSPHTLPPDAVTVTNLKKQWQQLREKTGASPEFKGIISLNSLCRLNGSLGKLIFFVNPEALMTVLATSGVFRHHTASIFGNAYASIAHKWEWIYQLPYSSVLAKMPFIRDRIKVLYPDGHDLDGLMDTRLGKRSEFGLLDFVDSVISTAYIMALAFGVITGAPVLLPAMALFSVSRGAIFVTAHQLPKEDRVGWAVTFAGGILLTAITWLPVIGALIGINTPLVLAGLTIIGPCLAFKLHDYWNRFCEGFGLKPWNIISPKTSFLGQIIGPDGAPVAVTPYLVDPETLSYDERALYNSALDEWQSGVDAEPGLPLYLKNIRKIILDKKLLPNDRALLAVSRSDGKVRIEAAAHYRIRQEGTMPAEYEFRAVEAAPWNRYKKSKYENLKPEKLKLQFIYQLFMFVKAEAERDKHDQVHYEDLKNQLIFFLPGKDKTDMNELFNEYWSNKELGFFKKYWGGPSRPVQQNLFTIYNWKDLKRFIGNMHAEQVLSGSGGMSTESIPSKRGGPDHHDIVRTWVNEMAASDIKEKELMKVFKGLNGAATRELISYLRETESMRVMQVIAEILLETGQMYGYTGDLSVIPDLQEIYFSDKNTERKKIIASLLNWLMTEPEHIATWLPGREEPIWRATAENRLSDFEVQLRDYIPKIPRPIILNLGTSEGLDTVQLNGIVRQSAPDAVIYAFDAAMALYKVEFDDLVCIVNAAGKLMRCYDADTRAIAEANARLSTRGRWNPSVKRRNMKAVEDKCKEILGKCRLSDSPEITDKGIKRVTYSFDGFSVTPIFLLHPKAVQAAQNNDIRFQRLDFQKDSLPAADLIIISNALGGFHGYSDNDTTFKTLRHAGRFLNEGGRLIVGNNAPQSGAKYFYALYERKGNNLVLKKSTRRSFLRYEGEGGKQVELSPWEIIDLLMDDVLPEAANIAAKPALGDEYVSQSDLSTFSGPPKIKQLLRYTSEKWDELSLNERKLIKGIQTNSGQLRRDNLFELLDATEDIQLTGFILSTIIELPEREGNREKIEARIADPKTDVRKRALLKAEINNSKWKIRPDAIDKYIPIEEIIASWLGDMNSAVFDKNIKARAAFKSAGAAASGILLKLLEKSPASSPAYLTAITQAIIEAGDITVIPEIQILYGRERDSVKKEAYKSILHAFLQGEKQILTATPGSGPAAGSLSISRATWPNRLASLDDDLVKFAASRKNPVIVDCPCSDGVTTSSMSKLLYKNRLTGTVIGVDINLQLSTITHKSYSVVFDSRGNVVGAYNKDTGKIEEYYYYSKSYIRANVPQEIIEECRSLLKRTDWPKEPKIVNGEIAQWRKETPAGTAEIIYMLDPDAAAHTAGQNINLHFKQGDIFDLHKAVPSADVIVCANLFSNEWEYYNDKQTFEALQSMGRTLKNGGRIYVGYNPDSGKQVAGYGEQISGSFIYVVYQREGDRIVLNKDINKRKGLPEVFLCRDSQGNEMTPWESIDLNPLTEIEIPDRNSRAASILGNKYVSIAHKWEWIYALLFSTFIAESRFAKVLLLRLNPGRADDINAFQEKSSRAFFPKAIDIVGSLSLLFGTALYMTGMQSGSVIAAVSLAVFMVSRGIIFGAAHTLPSSHELPSSHDQIILSAVGIAFAAVVALPLALTAVITLPISGVVILPAAAGAGLFLNIGLHKVYNDYIAPLLGLPSAEIPLPLYEKYVPQLIDSSDQTPSSTDNTLYVKHIVSGKEEQASLRLVSYDDIVDDKAKRVKILRSLEKWGSYGETNAMSVVYREEFNEIRESLTDGAELSFEGSKEMFPPLFALSDNDEVQGLFCYGIAGDNKTKMINGRKDRGQAVKIFQYLEIAPWNRDPGAFERYIGTGNQLMYHGVRDLYNMIPSNERDLNKIYFILPSKDTKRMLSNAIDSVLKSAAPPKWKSDWDTHTQSSFYYLIDNEPEIMRMFIQKQEKYIKEWHEANRRNASASRFENKAATHRFAASILSKKYAVIAPYWEWIYAVPFSMFIARSRLMKPVFGALIPSMTMEEIQAKIGEGRNPLLFKVIDAACSLMLAGTVLLTLVGIPAGLPLIAAVGAVFSISRGIIFAAAHKWAGDSGKTFSLDQIKLGIMGTVFAILTVMPSLLVLGGFSVPVPGGVITAFVAGLVSSIILHAGWNRAAQSDRGKRAGMVPANIVAIDGLSENEIVSAVGVDNMNRVKKYFEPAAVGFHFKDGFLEDVRALRDDALVCPLSELYEKHEAKSMAVFRAMVKMPEMNDTETFAPDFRHILVDTDVSEIIKGKLLKLLTDMEFNDNYRTSIKAAFTDDAAINVVMSLYRSAESQDIKDSALAFLELCAREKWLTGKEMGLFAMLAKDCGDSNELIRKAEKELKIKKDASRADPENEAARDALRGAYNSYRTLVSSMDRRIAVIAFLATGLLADRSQSEREKGISIVKELTAAAGYDARWGREAASSIISELAIMLPSIYPSEKALVGGHLAVLAGETESFEELSMLNNIKKTQKVLPLLKNRDGKNAQADVAKERFGYLLLLMNGNSTRFLETIVLDNTLDMRYRLFAFNLYCRSCDPGSASSFEKDFKQLIGSLLTEKEGVIEFLRESSRGDGNTPWFVSLFENSYLQDQAAQVYSMAVALAIMKDSPEMSPAGFIEAVKQGAIHSRIYAHLNDNYQLGKIGELSVARTSPAVFLMTLAHEAGHNFMRIAYPDHEYSDLQEAAAEAYALRMAGTAGIDSAPYRLAMGYPSLYETVLNAGGKAYLPHDGRALVYALMEKGSVTPERLVIAVHAVFKDGNAADNGPVAFRSLIAHAQGISVPEYHEEQGAPYAGVPLGLDLVKNVRETTGNMPGGFEKQANDSGAKGVSTVNCKGELGNATALRVELSRRTGATGTCAISLDELDEYPEVVRRFKEGLRAGQLIVFDMGRSPGTVSEIEDLRSMNTKIKKAAEIAEKVCKLAISEKAGVPASRILNNIVLESLKNGYVHGHKLQSFPLYLRINLNDLTVSVFNQVVPARDDDYLNKAKDAGLSGASRGEFIMTTLYSRHWLEQNILVAGVRMTESKTVFSETEPLSVFSRQRGIFGFAFMPALSLLSGTGVSPVTIIGSIMACMVVCLFALQTASLIGGIIKGSRQLRENRKLQKESARQRADALFPALAHTMVFHVFNPEDESLVHSLGFGPLNKYTKPIGAVHRGVTLWPSEKDTRSLKKVAAVYVPWGNDNSKQALVNIMIDKTANREVLYLLPAEGYKFTTEVDFDMNKFLAAAAHSVVDEIMSNRYARHAIAADTAAGRLWKMFTNEADNFRRGPIVLWDDINATGEYDLHASSRDPEEKTLASLSAVTEIVHAESVIKPVRVLKEIRVNEAGSDRRMARAPDQSYNAVLLTGTPKEVGAFMEKNPALLKNVREQGVQIFARFKIKSGYNLGEIKQFSGSRIVPLEGMIIDMTTVSNIDAKLDLERIKQENAPAMYLALKGGNAVEGFAAVRTMDQGTGPLVFNDAGYNDALELTLSDKENFREKDAEAMIDRAKGVARVVIVPGALDELGSSVVQSIIRKLNVPFSASPDARFNYEKELALAMRPAIAADDTASWEAIKKVLALTDPNENGAQVVPEANGDAFIQAGRALGRALAAEQFEPGYASLALRTRQLFDSRKMDTAAAAGWVFGLAAAMLWRSAEHTDTPARFESPEAEDVFVRLLVQRARANGSKTDQIDPEVMNKLNDIMAQIDKLNKTNSQATRELIRAQIQRAIVAALDKPIEQLDDASANKLFQILAFSDRRLAAPRIQRTQERGMQIYRAILSAA